MGASTSTGYNSEGLTLERLMEEANRVLGKATEVITQTVGSEISNLTNFHERTVAKVASTYRAIQDKLAELSRYGDEAQTCVRRKEAELRSIQLKMKNSMIECYGKHSSKLEKLQPERAIIHNEAKQLKLEAQTIIQNCMMTENRLDCFQKGLSELSKRADDLLKKFKAHAKHEMEVQANTSKLLVECDKKIMDEANKSFNRIIEEVRKCSQGGIDNI